MIPIFSMIQCATLEELKEAEFTATKDKYLSGDEQRRAFHENKIMVLQRELLATPYARSKNGNGAQTSFLDDLLGDDNQHKGKVMPFQTFKRRRSGGQ